MTNVSGLPFEAIAVPGSPAGLEVRIHRNIDEIAPAEWDALIDPDDLQATHRFVRACQNADIEGSEYRHVMILRGGTVEAVATFCAFSVPLDVLATGIVRHALNLVRRGWRPALRVPVVFGGLPVSFGRSCLRLAAHAPVDEVIGALCNVADRFAAEVRAPIICFKEFGAEESSVTPPLLRRGYLLAPSLPGCRLALPWRSMDAYAGAMRAPYRRQLLATRRARAEHGLMPRTVRDWRSEAGRIHALYEQVIDRAQFKLERLPRAFLECLAAGLPVESAAILLEKERRLVSAAIVLDGPSTTTFLLVGMDYEVAHSLSAYHVIVDEVVAHAIERGARAVELGQTSYDRKLRLGAISTPRDLFVRCRSRVGHRLLALARGALFPTTPIQRRRVFRDGGL